MVPIYFGRHIESFVCLFKFINSVFNHSLSFPWIKVKALSVRFFVQFGNLFFLSYFLLPFYFIRVKLNPVHPKDATGTLFVHPTKVLCI